MQADGDFCVAFNVVLGLAVIVLIFVVLGLVISRRRLKRQVARLVHRFNVRRIHKPANPVTTQINGGTRVTPPVQVGRPGNTSIRAGNTGTYDEVLYFTNQDKVHVSKHGEHLNVTSDSTDGTTGYMLEIDKYLNVTSDSTDDTTGYMPDIDVESKKSKHNTVTQSGCCGGDGQAVERHSGKNAEDSQLTSNEKIPTDDESTLATVEFTPKVSTIEESDVATDEPQHTMRTDASNADTTYNRLADIDDLEHVYREIN